MNYFANVDWSSLPPIPEPTALELFAAIAEQSKYTLTLSPKKYMINLPVRYCAVAIPHGANAKPIRGEGHTPDEAIRDLWEKLNGYN